MVQESNAVGLTIQRLLKSKEAAFLLGISTRKLWGLAVSREIPSIRIGRSVRYDPGDLQAYISRRKTK